jgi:hypothetical protein
VSAILPGGFEAYARLIHSADARETGSLPLAQTRVLIDLLAEERGSGSSRPRIKSENHRLAAREDLKQHDDDDEGEYQEDQERRGALVRALRSANFPPAHPGGRPRGAAAGCKTWPARLRSTEHRGEHLARGWR